MPTQEFALIDYTGPVVVGVIFATCLFVISIFLNFCCITKHDEITEFERWGAKRNLRMGPHRVDVVKRFCDKKFIADE